MFKSGVGFLALFGLGWWLGPGGRMVFSTLGADLSGEPAQLELAESFNATCKREMLQGRNTRRRHSSLGQRSPIAYETALETTSTPLVPAA